MLSMRRGGVTVFDPVPAGVPRLSWPTRRRDLFTSPDQYLARTAANPCYGQPGWTRDCGRRFHRGCDIAPLAVRPTGRTTKVIFSDCAAGTEYPSEQPTWMPDDEVYAVCEGEVAEVNTDEAASDLGLFVVVRHGAGPGAFHSLYAHLAAVTVRTGRPVTAGTRLGPMGTTSRSPDARNWMSVAPHLHFEVISTGGGAHDPLAFLKAGLPAA
jgi:hypothetical protein